MKIFSPLKQEAGDNLLINGAFNVWQRATTIDDNADRAHVYQTADRWAWTFTADGAAVPAAAVRAQHDNGIRIAYGVSGGGLVPNADTCGYISQDIENAVMLLCGRQNPAAQPVTLSFLASNSLAIPVKIGVALVIRYGTGGSADVIVPGRSFIQAAAAGISRYNFTFMLPSTVAKTITADNSIQLIFGVVWGTAFGTTYFNDAVAMGWGVAGGETIIGKAKLETGYTVTPFQEGAIQNEINRCRRYYRRFANGVSTHTFMGIGQAVNATSAFIPMPLDPAMYDVPVATQAGDLALMQANAAPEPVTSIFVNANYSTVDVIGLSVGVAANLVAGDAAVLWSADDIHGDLQLESEIP